MYWLGATAGAVVLTLTYPKLKTLLTNIGICKMKAILIQPLTVNATNKTEDIGAYEDLPKIHVPKKNEHIL